jgi:prepilin-type N-terminal cleavage/methylation domain-containing protein
MGTIIQTSKNKISKNNISKKGFALTELLAVLVIIALLTSVLFPWTLDEIRKAKQRAEIAETRVVMLALQTLLVTSYAEERLDAVLDRSNRTSIGLHPNGIEEMEYLAGIALGELYDIQMTSAYQIEGFRYTTPNGSLVVYAEGAFAVEKLY